MKVFKFFVLCNLAAAALMCSSCVEDIIETDDIISDDDLPAGVLPSKDFNPGKFVAEKYSDAAAKYNISDPSSSFSSVELFGDGTYLIISKDAAYQTQSSVAVAQDVDGGIKVYMPKSQQKASVSRAYGDYYISGGYTVEQKGNYVLDDFGTLKIDENGDGYNLTFDNQYGNRISTVYATKEPAVGDEAAESLCRAWNVNTTESWVYLGSVLLSNVKYIGGDVPRYEGLGDDVSEYEIQEAIDESCCKIIFSPYGTYYCEYNNGTVKVSTWKWANKDQGTLFYDWQIGENDEGYVTVRFAGNQCRIYEDYTIDLSEYLEEDYYYDEDVYYDYVDLFGEDGAMLRLLNVITLDAAQ